MLDIPRNAWYYIGVNYRADRPPGRKGNTMKYSVTTGNDIYEGLANSGPFDTEEEARTELMSLAYSLAEELGVDVESTNFVYELDFFQVSTEEGTYSGWVRAVEVKEG